MSQIRLTSNLSTNNEQASIDPQKVAFAESDIRSKLLRLDQALYVVQNGEAVGVCLAEDLKDSVAGTSMSLLSHVEPLHVGQLGDPEFMRAYGINMAYMTGAMANGIASEELVIASGKV